MSEKFKEFIGNCWKDHDKKTDEVSKNLRSNLNLIESEDQIPPYVGLITHTFGGHLGKWSEGLEVLEELSKLAVSKGNQAVYRAQACLSYCDGAEDHFKKFRELCTEEASELRIYAQAATELTGQGKVAMAKNAFLSAIKAAPANMTSENPGAKSLAISGNNLACELEDKAERSEEEVELMLLAAATARTYWEVAGGWLEVERAEYRLAMSHLKAKKYDTALRHARNCESICTENKANSFELFFAHEALTKVNRALCEHLKAQVKEEFQGYCVIP